MLWAYLLINAMRRSNDISFIYKRTAACVLQACTRSEVADADSPRPAAFFSLNAVYYTRFL